MIDFDYLARKALIHVYNTKPCSGSREEEDRDVASLSAVLRDAATHKVALNAQEAADEMGRRSAEMRAMLMSTFATPVHEMFSGDTFLRWSAAVDAYEPFVHRKAGV